jgi:hypothetical protein
MNRNPLTRRRGVALVAAAGLAASAAAALPATASETGNGVRDGSNITVFHNIDFVAVFGYGPVGSPVTVEVLRGGATIGTATGPAIDAEGLPGLEVNHGPEGAAVAGDCWEGHTPDIRPGDVVRVTDGGGTDQVTVDNIAFTGDPFEARDGDILVPFTAKRFNGTAVPASFIDSAEFRATSRLRFEATDIRVVRAGAPGKYFMRYNSPFRPSRNRDLLNQRQLRRLLLGDGHAIGFGHTDPLPAESMLHDGLADSPGPAPGCEAAPSAQWTANGANPGVINVTNRARGLTVRGLSHDATGVDVTLSDNDAATASAPLTAAATLSAASGVQQWTKHFTPQQLEGFNRRIRVAVRFTLADGAFTDRSLTVVKDVVRPNEPKASVASGAYNRTQRVALRSRGNTIRYTLGNGKQAAPTARSGARYNRRVVVSSSQVLKAVSIDPAGNVSPVARFRYRIR